MDTKLKEMHMTPKAKYKQPQTSSQEIGWAPSRVSPCEKELQQLVPEELADLLS